MAYPSDSGVGAAPGSPPPAKRPRQPAKPAAAPAYLPATPTTDYAALLHQILAGAPAPLSAAQMQQQAAASANSDVNAQVEAIRAQQAALLQAASQRATQQNAAAQAAAQYLQGLNLPGQTNDAFAQAAAAERAAAQGYSGGLRQTVDDAAAQVQRNLDAAGSPQTAENQGAAAGNVLYGLGGNLPAQRLDVAGPMAAATLAALPAQTLGYGQQMAVGALGAGQQEAAKLNPDILAAEAQRAKLTAANLAQLQDYALKTGQDRAANTLAVLKLQADQNSEQATNAWRNAQLSISAAKANRPQTFSAGGGRYQIDPKTGKVITLVAPPAKTWTSGGGIYGVDPKTGKIVTLKQPDSATEINPAVSKLRGYLAYGDGTFVKDTKGNPVPVAATGAPAKPSYYTDSFGRRIEIGTDGNQQVLSGGKYYDPASGVTYRVDLDGKMVAFTKGRAPKKPTPHYTTVSDATGTYVVNEGTGAKRRVAGPKSSSSAPKTMKTAAGIVQWNPATRSWERIPGAAGRPAAKPAKPLTPAQIGEVNDTVKFLQSGVPDSQTAGGADVPGKPALNFADAVTYMGDHGYFSTPQLSALTWRALKRAYPAWRNETAIAANTMAGPARPSATAPPAGP